MLIWSEISGGEMEYCALLVAVNSVLQIVLFAPVAVLFIRVISKSEDQVDIEYATVAESVAVFLGIPLGAAIVTRVVMLHLVFKGEIEKFNKYFVRYIAPLSLLGLLFTITILFAGQSRNVVTKITSVLRVCAPLLVYFFGIFAVTLWACRWWGKRGDGKGWRDWGYKYSAVQSLTAASNNFELAIAVAVAVYGADSDQALAATVGPLVEVPVLLGLVEVLK